MSKKINISKQLASAAACFLLFISLFILPVNAAETSGKSGKTSWNYANGVLTVSGSGVMSDYAYDNLPPWYEYRNDITKVVIGNGVTYIGEAAFYDCSNLKTVNMSNSVKSIGSIAFLECVNLESINLSSGLKTIKHGAFKSCLSLKTIILPDGLETIEYEAFFDCGSLKTIVIPSSVKQMGSSVFAHCDSLLQVTVDAKVDTLPSWTFYGCESLKNVTLSSSIKEIGDNSFYNCENLQNVTGDVNEEVRNEISKQVNGTIGNETNQGSEIIEPNKGNSIQEEVIDNDNVLINGSITGSDGSINATIDATIKDDDGWKEVSDKVDSYINTENLFNQDVNVEVNVNLNEDQKVSGELLNELAGKNVNLVIKGNGEVKIDCSLLNPNINYGDLSIGYELDKVDKPSKNMINVIGNSEAFTLKLKGSSEFKVTVKVSLGREYALHTASLYQRDGSGYNYIQTVQIDTDGNASFYFESYDSWTTYLIGIDANSENVLIPDEMNNTLTDEYGNKYQITGVKSKWGISLGTFSLIIFGIVAAVILIIGGVMFMIFKRQQANEKIRREVMSEGYSKEENIKNTKTTKKKLFKKKK